MNTTIGFELAKLLKEKAFDLPCRLLYKSEEKLEEGIGEDYNWNHFDCWSAPTIAEVVMWLYEKHGIWIGLELIDYTREFYFQPTIWASKDREYHDEDMIDQAKTICKWKEWRYNSPTEAYEAAIDYTLKNLIP